CSTSTRTNYSGGKSAKAFVAEELRQTGVSRPASIQAIFSSVSTVSGTFPAPIRHSPLMPSRGFLASPQVP
ncbi:MAG: hypothetical protein M3127_09535, partial [Actinomycetota bacterium]|nr:hypothetical protein [Actinomycetota bacterium]